MTSRKVPVSMQDSQCVHGVVSTAEDAETIIARSWGGLGGVER